MSSGKNLEDRLRALANYLRTEADSDDAPVLREGADDVERAADLMQAAAEALLSPPNDGNGRCTFCHTKLPQHEPNCPWSRLDRALGVP